MTRIKWIFVLCVLAMFVVLLVVNNQESDTSEHGMSDKPIITQANDVTGTSKILDVSERQHTIKKRDDIKTTSDNSLVEAAYDNDVYIPPIAKQTSFPNKYSGDLDDHQSYLAHELKRERVLKRAFVTASNDKITRLTKLVERAKKEGLPKEDIAFALKKIADLQRVSLNLSNELSVDGYIYNTRSTEPHEVVDEHNK